MSLETAITRAWQRQALWLWLLLPISWLYALLMTLRRQAYRIGLFASYRAPIPVMIIGNITVGGSGKTPLIISLVEYLQKNGVHVGVISRGYGGNSDKMPALVTQHSSPSEVGDEPCLIVSLTNVPMAVSPNREKAIKILLESHPKLQLIIADDGLQHYALRRDIEWIVVDVDRGFGSQQLLPTGFLREPMSRLKGATVIAHEKPMESLLDSIAQQSSGHLVMRLHADDLQNLWTSVSDHSQAHNDRPILGDTVHAISGIGYPKRFFSTLSALGFEVIPHPYPDHYDFSLAELQQYDQYPIIMTSKDAVKVHSLLLRLYESHQSSATERQALASRLWILPVTATLSDACYLTLKQQLAELKVYLSDDKINNQ